MGTAGASPRATPMVMDRVYRLDKVCSLDKILCIRCISKACRLDKVCRLDQACPAYKACRLDKILCICKACHLDKVVPELSLNVGTCIFPSDRNFSKCRGQSEHPPHNQVQNDQE